MSEMISFRDLIDLEPKPKKVKFQYESYQLSVKNNYIHIKNAEYLENDIEFNEMKEPNIEIIEEEKPLVQIPEREYLRLLSLDNNQKEDKTVIEKLEIKKGNHSNNCHLENEEGIKCGMPKHALVMVRKINELCGVINEMGKVK